MLVFKRKRGQAIRIGEDVEVFVADIHSGYVKLGVRAPTTLTVVRSELAETPAPPEEPQG